jgi:ABC-2 type transport system ATP-binding protein
MSTTSSARLPTDPDGAPIAITLDDISICYKLYQGGRPLLQDYLASIFAQRPLRRDVWALRNVTLSVRRGEVLGLVGSNGSGKSTLLKVVARILRPTSGRVVVHGNVAPLIELGAGFQPELTGRENVLLKSAILGHPERDARRRISRIIDFAGLHEFIDAPLHTYSSGMVARLAFAVATDVQPDILMIDEVLSVGDAEFRERSEQRIADLRRAGTTLLIVSHNSAALRRMCDRVGWLAYGRLQMQGDVADVIGAYEGGLRPASDDASDVMMQAASARHATPLAVNLRADQKLFVLEAPGGPDPTLVSAIESHFDPEHICPYHVRDELPQGAKIALAHYRLVRGAYFYDQMTQLLHHMPICAAILPATTIPRAARDADTLALGDDRPALTTVDNPLTRLLGQRSPSSGSVSLDREYQHRPVDHRDLTRACAVLSAFAFVGLAARPRESLMLLWYTFGWPPDQALLLAQPLPQHDLIEQGEQPDTLDAELSAYAQRLFDQRYNQMLDDLAERYAHTFAEGLTPPFPLEIQIGLLRKHHQWRRAERGAMRALRFTFDRPVPGTGWYGVEYNPQHGTFRWTGPDRRSTLQLPLDRELADASLSLRCHILLASRPSVLRSLRFFVNDQPVSVTQSRSWDGSILCEGPIPPFVLAGSSFARITLEVDKTVVPSPEELLHQESRHLGVALSWIELMPAETLAHDPSAAHAHETARGIR